MNQCPECHSNRIFIGYQNITCLSCGFAESLIDFPVSYDFHALYSFDTTRGIPPDTQVAEDQSASVNARIEHLEAVQPTEMNRQQWQTVQQIAAKQNYLQNKINDHLDKSKKKKASY